MTTTKELQYPVSLMVTPSAEDHLELSRLLAAAIVNPSFCRLLLADPETAVENGYQGETFLLSDAYRYLIMSIHADSLSEFAGQIALAQGPGLHAQPSNFAQAPGFFGY